MPLMTFMNTFALALAKTTIDPGGWAGQYFSAIRYRCIEHAGVISSLAMTLACVFITFMFIKMYYDIASDEQSGGFGGIRIWDILRPIALLLVIASFSTWASWLDSICNTVSASLIANMNASADAVDEDMMAKLEELEDEINKSNSQIMREAKQQAEQQVGRNYDENLKAIRNLINENSDGTLNDAYNATVNSKGEIEFTGSGFSGSKKIYTVEELMGHINGNEAQATLTEAIQDQAKMGQIRQESESLQKETKKWAKWLQKGGSIIGSVITWLYNIIFVIMMAFSDIILCLLIIFGPIACALSILDPWRQTFTKWIGSYIEISMWKPIASAITWITLQARSAIGTMGLRAVDYGVNLTAEAGKGTILGAIGVEALIMAAGIFAILQIPGIANTLLSLGGMGAEAGGGASGMVHAAAAAPGKMIGGGAKMLKDAGKTGANTASRAASSVSRAGSGGSDFMRTMYGDIPFD